jgi:type I restriction enzyme, S subunit
MYASYGYFFRSVMFQAQVEREKRGMGNMTNIFPSRVERMRIPTCSLSRQNKLADQITTSLAQIDAHCAAIESKRKKKGVRERG